MATLEKTQSEVTFLDSYITSKNLQRSFMSENLARLRNLSEKVFGSTLTEDMKEGAIQNYSCTAGLLQQDLDETQAINMYIQEVIEKMENFI